MTQSNENRQRRGLLGSLAAGAAIVLGKLKLLLGFGLKLGKLGATGWTMLASMWLYSLQYGWSFAVGLVLLILVHEAGHALAAGAVGLPVSAPVFVPFFGAYVKLGQLPRSRWEAFLVSMGGPLVGATASALCVLAAGPLDSGLLHTLGYFGLFMNLFNLLPIGFLDGAKALAAVPVRAGVAGLAVCGFTLFVSARETGRLNFVPLLVLGVAAWQLWSRPRAARDQDEPQGGLAATIFFATVALLTVGVEVLQPR